MLLIQTWLAVFTNLAIFGFSSEQMAQWIPSFFVEDADGECNQWRVLHLRLGPSAQLSVVA